MQEMLVKRFGFRMEDIAVLCNAEASEKRILAEFLELVKRAEESAALQQFASQPVNLISILDADFYYGQTPYQKSTRRLVLICAKDPSSETLTFLLWRMLVLASLQAYLSI